MFFQCGQGTRVVRIRVQLWDGNKIDIYNLGDGMAYRRLGWFVEGIEGYRC
jgi:hypothetical protein